MNFDNISLEKDIFSIIDDLKFLFFPDQWSGMFLDYSKNEILVLIFLYRFKTANMTEISEYINSPLNTSTGVINRLEKKQMVERIRSNEDRRVVQITLTNKAIDFINKEKTIIIKYFSEIYTSLTEEERAAAISIFSKAVEIINQSKKGKNSNTGGEVKKIKKIILE